MLLEFIHWLLILGCSLYCILIFLIVHYWDGLQFSDIAEKDDQHRKMSVVLAIHNEAKNLKNWFESFRNAKNTIQGVEVILSDDHSSDGSVPLSHQFLSDRDQLISSNKTDNRGKKHAIDRAVNAAEGDIVVVTDADCLMPDHWLDQFNHILAREDITLCCGPVFIDQCTHTIHWLQHYDLLATMMVSQVAMHKGWFMSCSAANMGYKKSFYLKSKPYQDNFDILSGDDIFLLEAVARDPEAKAVFLKHAHFFVRTRPKDSWSGLFRQRIRWAGKTKHYKQLNLKVFWIFLFSILLLFSISPFTFFIGVSKYLLFTIWAIKLFVDYWSIQKMIRFYRQSFNHLSFFACFVIYPYFTVTIAILSLFKRSK
jgi:glycosyltransferase involved in cell wall biosynthesis